MVSRSMFKTGTVTKVKPTNTVNAAGGKAYSRTAEETISQYVVTSTLNNTFYTSAEEQLKELKTVLGQCSSEFLAKAAVYGHEQARMKDVPAFVLATLAARHETELVRKIFPRVCTNAKMLCNFVQIVRSGETGRRSFGTSVRNEIRTWLLSRSLENLFTSNIGQANPSLADIIKMVHPKADLEDRNEMFKYLLGRECNLKKLPRVLQNFEKIKQGKSASVSGIPFRALTNFSLSAKDWEAIASDMPWNTLRMNLNMLERNGVFGNTKLTNELAAKLRNPEEVRRAKAFPYQLLTTYQNTPGLPSVIRNALQDALELSTENIPNYGPTVICVDTSGSMGGPVTGYRAGSTSVTRCIDVAALIACSILRKNPDSELIPFDTGVHRHNLNPRDSLVTNAANLARYGGGGTSCSSALRDANSRNVRAGLVIYVSDNESWLDYHYRHGTGLSVEWTKFKARNKGAKMVLIDLTPSANTQVQSDKDVLNVGSFSDSVFDVINKFLCREASSFVDVIKSVEL